jgi:hypothetical protein
MVSLDVVITQQDGQTLTTTSKEFHLVLFCTTSP